MGNYKTKQEAFKLLYWCLKTLFQKDYASISLWELKRELENAWNQLLEDGGFTIDNGE